MDRKEVEKTLVEALQKMVGQDSYLLENDLSERCIAARLAFYLQNGFRDYNVDVEYNRDGGEPKKLGLPPDCANRFDQDGNAWVVPDVVVHKRGPAGPNLLVLELKKTSNRQGTGCDRRRVQAFIEQYGYGYGAVILCETGNTCGMHVEEWFDR